MIYDVSTISGRNRQEFDLKVNHAISGWNETPSIDKVEVQFSTTSTEFGVTYHAHVVAHGLPEASRTFAPAAARAFREGL